MSNPKHLTKKQRDVLDDLFDGGADEQEILARHNISRRTYEKWLAEEIFVAEFDRRLASARRRSDLIIARFAYVAASKLALLTESESQETARKACLDIIGLLRKDKPSSQDQNADNPDNPPVEMAPEIAGRLLAAMANAEAEALPESPLGAQPQPLQRDEKQRLIQE
jgi:hypothetical protein